VGNGTPPPTSQVNGRRHVVSSGPVAGSGRGPDASPTFATLHSHLTNPAEVDRLVEALWNDLARVIATGRARAAGSKGS
jgi:hypothetical protein